ncbi:hypothetical protein BDD43_3715 [Mucilaginibacter gracilis]|uniref:Uncharacterized protein n=1 Tax=Mucilaginibacter gracilis TaxID=423350 RepID=A0A495J3E0_9SPHI|nr:hypothetical protein [Mucilaginibacter gracilis]RKR83505.1 hypothetical protein BDD43_3715 [Mucilaginibacter gracilis]
MEISIYIDLLNGLEFDKLEQKLMEMPFNVMEDIINRLAYDSVKEESNLLVYTFLYYLLCKHETSELHFLISKLMGVTLNHIRNAESIGLYHGLQASRLDPDNIDILEYLLYYNQIPEKPLSDKIAISFAKQIIDKRPQSVAAKMRIGLF